MYISHFSCFSLFLATFQVLQCVFLILHIFQYFLPYSMSYDMSLSLSSFDSSLAILQVLQRAFLFFHDFRFLAIFQVLECAFLILHFFFTVSCLFPGPTVCVSHVPLFFFFSFLAIFQVLECVCLIFLICQFSRHIPGPTVFMYHFRRFSVFSPLSRSYSAYFSFFTFFTVSRHIPGHTCVRFIFQVF